MPPKNTQKKKESKKTGKDKEKADEKVPVPAPAPADESKEDDLEAKQSLPVGQSAGDPQTGVEEEEKLDEVPPLQDKDSSYHPNPKNDNKEPLEGSNVQVTAKEKREPFKMAAKKEMPGIETRKRFILENIDPNRTQKTFEKEVFDIDLWHSTAFILKSHDGRLFFSFKEKNNYSSLGKIPKTKMDYWPPELSKLQWNKLLKSPLVKSYAFEIIHCDPLLSTATNKDCPSHKKLPSTEFSDEGGEDESVSSRQDVVSFKTEPRLNFQKPLPKPIDLYEEELVRLKQEMQVGFQSWKDLYKKYSVMDPNDRLFSALRYYKDLLLELESEINSVWADDPVHQQLVEKIAHQNAKEREELLLKRLNPLTEVQEGEDPMKKRKLNGGDDDAPAAAALNTSANKGDDQEK